MTETNFDSVIKSDMQNYYVPLSHFQEKKKKVKLLGIKSDFLTRSQKETTSFSRNLQWQGTEPL